MLTTTLNRIRAHSPCRDGWERLLHGLGKTGADDDALPYADILRINGLNDAIWACRAEPQYASTWRSFAVKCARAAEHLPTDPRSLAALDVAERHARGEANDAELAAAWEDAAASAYVAYADAADAAYAAYVAYADAAAAAADAAYTAIFLGMVS